MIKLNLKTILLTAILAVSMLNVSAFLGRNKKQYPLHYAASKFDTLSFKIGLLKSNLSSNDLINLQNDKGQTPLHVAVSMKITKKNYHEAIKFVKYLIFEKQANVNIQDNEGNTPLHYVMDGVCTKIAFFTYLLMGGANIDIKNNNEQTIWDIHFNSEETKKDLAGINLTFSKVWMMMALYEFENLNKYSRYFNDQPDGLLKLSFDDFDSSKKNKYLKKALEVINDFIIEENLVTAEAFIEERDKNLLKYN